jgi:hypothetical protein
VTTAEFKRAFRKTYKRDPTKEELPNNKTEIVVLFMRIVFLIVALGCAFMSIYFTRLLFINNLGEIKASILSSIMVLYLVFAFVGATYLKRLGYNGIAKVVIITAFIVMSFSMLSTTAGLYNNRTEHIKENNNGTKTLILQTILDSEKTLDDNLKLLQQDLKDNQKALENEYTDKLFWKGYRIKKDITIATKELEVKRTEKIGYLTTNTSIIEETERKNFTTMVSRYIIKIDKEKIEFAMDVFPAIFIDILAPLGMYIALGRRKEE